ncbi:hypothetical protein PG987_010697 [Apiospora arundinis]
MLPSLWGARDLCKVCAEINFDQFASSATPSQSSSADTHVALLSLFDIIKHHRKGKCKFCCLLFHTIALKEHDPFNHPAITLDDLQFKTFEAWVKGVKWYDQIRNTPHPFSKKAAEEAGVVTGAAAAGAAAQAAAQQQDRDRKTILSVLGNGGLAFNSALAIMQNDLPAVVVVTVHKITDPDRGLLNIALMGYGNKGPQAPLSILSSFNLRVASDYQYDGLGLRYGKIISAEVNVKDDCRKWLDHCRQHHGQLCAKPDWSVKLPPPLGEHFRLIEIGDQDDMFRLVNTSDQGSSWEGEYAALSYVWGDAGKQALNLYLHNINQLSKRIPPEKVARTISDAIKVTRGLRLRYLWVDSLCLIQKARAGEEESDAFQSQVDQMGQFEQMSSIYGRASVVIVATAGEDAQAGLAGVTIPRQPGQVAREVRPGVNVLLPFQYDKSYGKWDTRAWTLQEKLLSKRMLVFGSDHVAFHCRHGILREDMSADHANNGPAPMHQLSMPPLRGHGRVKKAWNGNPILLRSPFFDEYAKLMAQYTSRERSHSEDILKAVSGLLKVLGDMRSLDSEGVYTPKAGSEGLTLYGLPEDFLDLALLWQPPAVMGTHLIKRTQEDYPSWSWAGWEVSKSPSHGQTDGETHQVHPGVRYEEPFWVSGNDDMSLRKFVATGNDAEERFQSTTRWYKCRKLPPKPGQKSGPKPGPKPPPKPPRPPKPSNLMRNSKIYVEPPSGLVPVNDDGSGMQCVPSISPGIPLDNRHLVCETQAARFRLRQREKKPRKETLWKQDVDGKPVPAKELEILEAEILNDSDEVVGYVIPTDQGKTIATHPYDFIVLSESQYWGNEKRIDVVGFPLYNVMVVVWDTMGVFAERFGVGKISKSAWAAGHPSERCVALK